MGHYNNNARGGTVIINIFGKCLIPKRNTLGESDKIIKHASLSYAKDSKKKCNSIWRFG